MKVYHGGFCEIAKPEIRTSGNHKDFGQGFYCTELEPQARRWAKRYATPVVSVFECALNSRINVLRFDAMTEDWLAFIVNCRGGNPHAHDIVTGAMANDQVWNYIADYMNGILTREQFWVLAKFKHPTHQIVFCNEDALACLKFIDSYEVTP